MNKIYDVILLTESRYEKPAQIDWYVEQILTEDYLVQEALERRGLKTARLDWNNPDVDWRRTRFALFRTTWDYFHKYKQFRNWLDEAEQKTILINSAALARWNTDKHYLLDLDTAGIRIPPTLILEPGDHRSLADLHRETGWEHTVLKPAVSGAGRHTYQLKPENREDYEPLYATLIREEAMLLQPFQYDVVKSGELALMVIDGVVTHAVKKVAKSGDFRVQDDFGGTVHEHEPTEEEIRFAEAAVAACPEKPVYARVDIICDNEGELALAELELIEPEMWYRNYPPAAERLAAAVAARVMAERT